MTNIETKGQRRACPTLPLKRIASLTIRVPRRQVLPMAENSLDTAHRWPLHCMTIRHPKKETITTMPSTGEIESGGPTPSVAAVIIGRNEGARLVACLASVAPHVPQIVYVDSGYNTFEPRRVETGWRLGYAESFDHPALQEKIIAGFSKEPFVTRFVEFTAGPQPVRFLALQVSELWQVPPGGLHFYGG